MFDWEYQSKYSLLKELISLTELAQKMDYSVVEIEHADPERFYRLKWRIVFPDRSNRYILFHPDFQYTPQYSMHLQRFHFRGYIMIQNPLLRRN